MLVVQPCRYAYSLEEPLAVIAFLAFLATMLISVFGTVWQQAQRRVRLTGGPASALRALSAWKSGSPSDFRCG